MLNECERHQLMWASFRWLSSIGQLGHLLYTAISAQVVKRIKPASGLKPEVNYHEAITQMVADSYAQEFNKACAQAAKRRCAPCFDVALLHLTHLTHLTHTWHTLHCQSISSLLKHSLLLYRLVPEGWSSSQIGIPASLRGENPWCLVQVFIVSLRSKRHGNDIQKPFNW